MGKSVFLIKISVLEKVFQDPRIRLATCAVKINFQDLRVFKVIGWATSYQHKFPTFVAKSSDIDDTVKTKTKMTRAK